MIIEFSGLPRSGKTTSITVLRDILVRSGYSTRLNAERAQSCPFNSKYRTQFAVWTANQALNDVLTAGYTLPHGSVFLQDRGIFDALAFFRLLHIENRIDSTDFERYAEYIVHPNWSGLVDLVILFYVEPSVAIKRDLASKIQPAPALITNEQTLRKLVEAFSYVHDKFGDRFPQIVSIDTTHQEPIKTVQQVTDIVRSILHVPS